MTITYLDGKRIQGLNSDTKPTSVETNSLFEETDTGSRSWYNGTTWTRQPAFEDNFTYTSQASADVVWVSNDSRDGHRVNISTGVLEHSTESDATNDHIAYDIGSTVSNQWVLRFKLTPTAQSSFPQPFIGLSSANQTVANNQAQHCIFASFGSSVSSFDALQIRRSAGTDPDENGVSVTAGTMTNLANGTPYYFELIRNGDTVTCKIFSDSTYTTLNHANSTVTMTGASAVSGLRYIKFAERIVSNATSCSLSIDDLKFYNGVTSV